MSKIEHTPGPWVTFTKGNYDLSSRERKSWAIGICNRELKQDICLIDCGNKDDNFEIEQANANLIAEAPNLLKALKTIKDAFWTDGEDLQDRINDLKGVAEQAIAKAEGGKL